jgi:hypothetical protein
MTAALPDFLTVSEAGQVLRIGRNSAYRLATEYEETGGRSGLPVVRLGKLLRVPRVALEKLLGGELTWPLTDASKNAESASPDTPGSDPKRRQARASRRPADRQLGLEF